jgi:hypothetical protein
LPTAADCILASPYPNAPQRTVDVFSMGRRAPQVHAELVQRAERDHQFLYVYDSTRHGVVTDWSEARLVNASLIKRSRFFIAFDASIDGKAGVREDAISTRYFEGASGGAILLGSAPGCSEFRECFDWEDAICPIAPDGTDVTHVLDALTSRPERLARISWTNSAQCLRRHDWAHRWDTILGRVGLCRSVGHQERLDRLDALARCAERTMPR